MKLERYGIGIAKGMMVTLKQVFRHPTVSQYPEQKLHFSRRERGNELVWSNVKCTGCATCSKACPQGAIHIETTPDPKTNRYSVKIWVDTGYCIQCGLCVEACPYEALYLGYSVERAKYRRSELVLVNEKLLESPERPVSGFMNPQIAEKLPKQTLLLDKIVEKD